MPDCILSSSKTHVTCRSFRIRCNRANTILCPGKEFVPYHHDEITDAQLPRCSVYPHAGAPLWSASRALTTTTRSQRVVEFPPPALAGKLVCRLPVGCSTCGLGSGT